MTWTRTLHDRLSLEYYRLDNKGDGRNLKEYRTRRQRMFRLWDACAYLVRRMERSK